MKLRVLELILAGVIFSVAAGPVLAQHGHDHGANLKSQKAAVPARRWATDPPLREGMHRVQSALRVLHHYPMGHVSETMAMDQVQQIRDAGAYMFAHCKLPKEPDQALHEMLVPLLTAAQKLADNPQDMSQVEAMQAAVADYPRYFDDPGWSASVNAE